MPFDEILVAIGRVPCVEGLDLEKAGVKYDLKNADCVRRYTQGQTIPIFIL